MSEVAWSDRLWEAAKKNALLYALVTAFACAMTYAIFTIFLRTPTLSVLVYWSICLLRAFAGEGAAERRFAAALGVLGTINLPIIYQSVQKWAGTHPTAGN